MLPVVRVNHGQGVQTVMGLVWVTPLDLVQVPCLHDGCWRKDRYLLACRCAQRRTPLPELVIFYWRQLQARGSRQGWCLSLLFGSLVRLGSIRTRRDRGLS